MELGQKETTLILLVAINLILIFPVSLCKKVFVVIMFFHKNFIHARQVLLWVLLVPQGRIWEYQVRCDGTQGGESPYWLYAGEPKCVTVDAERGIPQDNSHRRNRSPMVVVWDDHEHFGNGGLSLCCSAYGSWHLSHTGFCIVWIVCIGHECIEFISEHPEQ